MVSINKVILVGNLGHPPEVRYMTDGKAVANMSLATTESWKDANGEKKEKTEWHRISTFGKLAEICAEYLTKGSSVYIEGKIQTRKWQDKEGNNRYTTEIIAEKMQMLGGSKTQQDAAKPAEKDATQRLKEMDDDIPFKSVEHSHLKNMLSYEDEKELDQLYALDGW